MTSKMGNSNDGSSGGNSGERGRGNGNGTLFSDPAFGDPAFNGSVSRESANRGDDEPSLLPVGAPTAPPPVTANPAAPVDLRPHNDRFPDSDNVLVAGQQQPSRFGTPGGRRSRAFRDSVNSNTVNKPEGADNPLDQIAADTRDAITTAPSPHRFTVHRGGDLTDDSEPDSVVRTLSPSTAAAIGDFAAAMIGPLAGGIATRNATVFLASALMVLVARARARRSALSEREVLWLSPVIAALAVLAFTIGVDPGRGIQFAVAVAGITLVAGAIAAVILDRLHDRFVHTRFALIGPASAAHDLAFALANEGISRYTITGFVGRDTSRENLRDLRHVSFKVRRLGVLADLSHIVARNDVDLLVLAEGGQRLEAFERAAVCSERYRTRLIGLPAFEEAIFQRVALEHLNVAWLQHIMHPRFRGAGVVVRVLDVAGASVLGLLTSPIWIAAAIAVRLSGCGPVIERHRRVGDRGRSFSILKFRTTAPLGEDDIPSMIDGSPRTRVGCILRKTHADALPLLINVLRGDMSLVGPRPAKPRDVTRLEQDIPFYGRRHLLKPGITGWAQLHAARDDSDTEDDDENAAAEALSEATLLDLSRDLFYLKHQSIFLYGYVLLASLWRSATGSLRPRSRGVDH
ncbi:MAG: sugar transferase [Solirubrobacterales bacterium]